MRKLPKGSRLLTDGLLLALLLSLLALPMASIGMMNYRGGGVQVLGEKEKRVEDPAGEVKSINTENDDEEEEKAKEIRREYYRINVSSTSTTRTQESTQSTTSVSN